MYNNYKFTYANINKTAFEQEFSKRSSYYANVVMWTSLFSLPLFLLIDYLFCKDLWTDFLLLRLVGASLSYLIYSYAKENLVDNTRNVFWFISINVIIHSIICSLVPISVASPMPYFLILGIIMLIINTTIFWNPINSIYLAIVSLLIIFLIYGLKNDIEKYSILVERGGGVYFLLVVFGCILAYTRYQVVCRDVERSVMIDDANEKLIAKTEQIKDERFKVEDVNRKLKNVSESSLDNMTIIMDDFKSFQETVKTSVDSLKSNAENLSQSQLEILENITVKNETLNVLAQRLGDTATVNAAQNIESLEPKIQFAKELFDINPEVEKSVIDVAETAMLKGVNLQLNISPALNNVYQDKLFTEQLLSKLMSNVIRLSPQGSIITIRAEQQSDKSIIETISHGTVIGMDRLEEMMNRLKYSAITDDISLDHLGLIATKKMVESMGGNFIYNSEDSVGNYFKIEFPTA